MTKKELFEKIKDLEKRIQDLEARPTILPLQVISAPGIQQPQWQGPYLPQWYVTCGTSTGSTPGEIK